MSFPPVLQGWVTENRIDVDQIDAVAQDFARQLGDHGAARTTINPGDGSIYQIMAVAPVHTSASPASDMGDGARNIWVSLVGHGGQGYLYQPGYYTADYVEEKWAPHSAWTARIMTLFLNALSEALTANRE